MLSGYDDYPIHQAPVPVSQTAGSDANFYDRYFFNGYERDGSVYFCKKNYDADEMKKIIMPADGYPIDTKKVFK